MKHIVFIAYFFIVIILFLIIYKRLNKKFPVDSKFLPRFGFYVLWAAVQQAVVFLSVHWLSEPRWLYAIFIFSIFHLFNYRLLFFCFCLACAVYPVHFLVLDFYWQTIILHALSGTLYYFTGWPMDVYLGKIANKIKGIIK